MSKKSLSNKGKRIVALAMSTVMLASLVPQTAFAADYVNTVSITLNFDLKDGETIPSISGGYTGDTEAEITIPDNKWYEIADVEWSSDKYETAELGEAYRMKVTLTARDDYEFRSSYSSSKIKIRGGELVSVRRGSSRDELVVTLKTDKVEGVLDYPQDVEWKSTNYRNSKFGYASWDKVDDAAYDLILYRNGKTVHRVNGLKKTTYNFYPYMTKEGDYTFRVRAVPVNDSVKEYAESSGWEYSDELYVDDDEVSDGTGQGLEDTGANTPNISNPSQVGWILSGNKWFFRYPDGSYLRDSWGKIGDAWYLFDSAGEMLTGWHYRNNAWYYMNGTGAMHTGWLLDKNIWYYLSSSGAMHTGWLTVNNLTYYLEPNGAMATGWKEVGGQWYFFYPDGHKAVNEVISGFYVDKNGVWKRP